MTVNAKATRLIVLGLVVVAAILTARSMHTTQYAQKFWSKPLGASDVAASLRNEFFGTSEDAQTAGHNVAQGQTNELSTSAVAKLGLDGRPTLPPLELIAQAAQRAPKPKNDGSNLSGRRLQDYVDSIFDLGNSVFWRMECPEQHSQGPRYQVLREIAKKDPGIKYFFALDLFEVVDILPRLLGSIIQVIKYLGAENCAISIIEGRSHDGTYNVLYGIQEELTKHGVAYWLDQSSINPHAEGVDRIEELSKLRNMALSPLLDPASRGMFSQKPLISFVNDVAICPDDLLEMIYQHLGQNATQTCAYDFVDDGNLFYDVWVSRSMSGNTFFEIPQDMSWAFSRNMFWDEPIAYTRYRQQLPLQVFSCWGGMVVLDARPFMDKQIAFRRSVEGECYGGEPQTLASDLVKLGINRVQTLPYVNVAYNNHEAELVKKKKGYVHEVVNVSKPVNSFKDDETDKIRWKVPPPRIRCMPVSLLRNT